ncbi:hypothetical protein GCM10028816_09620 [Spirosoma lituiforme]
MVNYSIGDGNTVILRICGYANYHVTVSKPHPPQANHRYSLWLQIKGNEQIVLIGNDQATHITRYPGSKSQIFDVTGIHLDPYTCLRWPETIVLDSGCTR